MNYRWLILTVYLVLMVVWFWVGMGSSLIDLRPAAAPTPESITVNSGSRTQIEGPVGTATANMNGWVIMGGTPSASSTPSNFYECENCTTNERGDMIRVRKEMTQPTPKPQETDDTLVIPRVLP